MAGVLRRGRSPRQLPLSAAPGLSPPGRGRVHPPALLPWRAEGGGDGMRGRGAGLLTLLPSPRVLAGPGPWATVPGSRASHLGNFATRRSKNRGRV